MDSDFLKNFTRTILDIISRTPDANLKRKTDLYKAISRNMTKNGLPEKLQNSFTKYAQRSHMHWRLFYFDVFNGKWVIELFCTIDTPCIPCLNYFVPIGNSPAILGYKKILYGYIVNLTAIRYTSHSNNKT